MRTLIAFAAVAALGLAALLVAFAAWPSATAPPTAPLCPGPLCPKPEPTKPNKPKLPRPGPWGTRGAPVGAKVGGPVAPDGTTEINCDLPGDLHLKNKGGSDGAGLCVFTSIAHSARWQNVPSLEDFRDWMTKHPGGGYPQKVTQMILRKCQETGVPEPAYVQVEGKDLEILKLACKTGRMPAVTYSYSPTGRYGGGRIAHMVSLPHADNAWFCVLDNNYPGVDAYEWMSPDEFQKTYSAGGNGWSVILLSPGPPPVPRNK
jgi:hypothetical protein